MTAAFGARTGPARTVPVLRLPTSDGVTVIASNFGRRRQPGWAAYEHRAGGRVIAAFVLTPPA